MDSTFGTGGEVLLTLGGNSVAKSVAIAPDGKLVVPGAYNGIGEFAVARFNNDGSFDTTFGAGGIVTTDIGDGASGSRAVALQSNGDIVVAGSAYLGGTPNFAVARYLPSAPQVGSFTASPNPVPSGSNLALTASGITDGNPNGTVTQVAFYRDSNGDGKLDANDALLGYGSQSNGVWAFSFSTTGLTAGTYTLFAQAKDSFGVLGDPFALALTVQ
ncbi:MAG: delta-60 repeat domain-containing protein [Gemmataceae bacterium]